MPIREEAINVFMGLPGDGDRLELTYNHGVDSYELGTGYNHIALTVDDIDGTLERLGEQGIEPEKPPYRVREGGSLIAFVRDPDGYRIELIEKNKARWSLGSRSSTAGRTRSASSSSPTRTRGGSARTRSTRPCASAKGWRRSGELQPEPMERALETLELYAHFCAATGIDEIRPVATSAIRDASNQAEFLAAARERSGLEVEVLPGPSRGALRLPGGGELDDAVRRRRAGPGRRLDAAHPRGATALAVDARSWPLGAVRMTERFAPGQEEAHRGAARARRDRARERRLARRGRAARRRSAARSATSPRRRSSPPGCPPTASRATGSRATRSAR